MLASSIANESEGDETSSGTFGHGNRFAHRSRHDLEFIQPTLQRTIEERNALRWRKADEFRDPQIAGKDIGSPSAESLFQPVTKLGIERIEFLRSAQPDSIGWIDQSARPVQRELRERARRSAAAEYRPRLPLPEMFAVRS